MSTTLRLGTRGSSLAIWQSTHVKKEIERLHHGITVELISIKTKGDKILDSPLSKIGDKGLFTKELESALLDKHIDLAVHSLKDLPTVLPDGLSLGGVTKRADVRDVFVKNASKNYKKLEDIPDNGLIATGSLRRKSQLLAWNNRLRIIEIRGNINTRLHKLDESDWDGMILAAAGLIRAGLHDRMTQIIETKHILPAAGQGALGIEIREHDNLMTEILGPVNDTDTAFSTAAERALLRRLEGGCQIPVGVWGRIENGILYLDAAVGSLDGSKIIRGNLSGYPEEAEATGISLAERLLADGADSILESIRNTELETDKGNRGGSTRPLAGKTIMITRDARQSYEIIRRINGLGGKTVCFPMIEISDPDSWEDYDNAFVSIEKYSGIIFTSTNAVRGFFTRAEKEFPVALEKILTLTCFAVGPKTGEALKSRGISEVIIPAEYNAESLLRLIYERRPSGKSFLFPAGNLTRRIIPEGLKELGAEIDIIQVYKTATPEDFDTDRLKKVLTDKKPDIITFFSPSAVENFFEHIDHANTGNAVFAAIGSTTREAAHRYGVNRIIYPEEFTSESLIDSIISHVTNK